MSRLRQRAVFEAQRIEGLNALVLFLEQPHRHPHPEELGRLQSDVLAVGLVNQQVAVVERLDTEVVEVEVGRRVERLGHGVDVVATDQRRVDPSDFHAAGEVGGKAGTVRLLELAEPVTQDGPVEHLLVDESQQDAAGELAEVGVLLDQRLGVEDDGGVEVLAGHHGANRTQQLALDLLGWETEVEAGAGEGNAAAQLHRVVRLVAARTADGDFAGQWRRLAVDHLGAVAGALGPVEDVVGCHGIVTLPHQLFLDHVLHVLDADAGVTLLLDAGGHRRRDVDGG